jgi:predicted MFS family arabinose efflux permease
VNPWRPLKGLPTEAWVVFTATLINRAGTMVLPFLVLYLTRSLGETAARAGFTIAVYGAGAIVTGPFAGRLCDRLGAHRVMRGSLLISGAILFVFPFVTSYRAILAVTFVWAVTNEAFRPANFATITEIVRPDQRKAAYALIRLAINLGMSVGPAVGGFLAPISFHALFYLDGVTSILGGLVLVLAPAFPERKAEVGSGAGIPGAPGRSILADRRLLYFLAALVPVQMVFFQFSSSLPLFLVHDLGLKESDFGLLLTMNTILIIFLEVALNLAMARWHHRWALALGSLLYAVGYGAFVLASGFASAAVCVTIWTFGEMILLPASAAYMGDIAPAARRGMYMGLYTMSFSISFALGPWLGTMVFDRLGSSAVWMGCLVLGSVAAALMLRVDAGPVGEIVEAGDATAISEIQTG